MADRTYFVICEDKCLFEAMTKEQIIAAIAEATGSTPTDVDSAFITKIKEQNANRELKFWVGTQAQYNAIAEPAEDTFYLITNPTFESDIQVEIAELQTQVAELEALKPIDVSDKITLTPIGILLDDVLVASKKFVFDPATSIVHFQVVITVTATDGIPTNQPIVLGHTGGYVPMILNAPISAINTVDYKSLFGQYLTSSGDTKIYVTGDEVIPNGTVYVTGSYFSLGE